MVTTSMAASSFSFASGNSSSMTPTQINQAVMKDSVEVQSLRNEIEGFLRDRGLEIRKEEVGRITGSIEGSLKGDLNYTSPFARAFTTLTGIALGGLGGAGLVGAGPLAGLTGAAAVTGGAAGGALGYFSKSPDATGQLEGKVSGKIDGRQYVINAAARVYGFNVVPDQFHVQVDSALRSNDQCLISKGQAARALLNLNHTVSVSEFNRLADRVSSLHKAIGRARVMSSQLAKDNPGVAQARFTELKEVSEWLSSIALIQTEFKVDPSSVQYCDLSQQKTISDVIASKTSSTASTRFEAMMKACLQAATQLKETGVKIHPWCEEAKQIVQATLKRLKDPYTISIPRPRSSYTVEYNSVYYSAEFIAEQVVNVIIWGKAPHLNDSWFGANAGLRCLDKRFIKLSPGPQACVEESIKQVRLASGYLEMDSIVRSQMSLVSGSEVRETYLTSLRPQKSE